VPKVPFKLRGKHSIIVVELDNYDDRENFNQPSIFVTSSSQSPKEFFEVLLSRQAELNLPGKPVRLLQELVLEYKPSRSKAAIARRLKETKKRLDKLGYKVFRHWRVYVLDVDPDHPEPFLDRGARNHVVYVGQTSNDIAIRLLQHKGERRGKEGQYLGAPTIAGRSPRINKELTPTRLVFCYQDALDFEAEYSQKLKNAGYRVLGDGLTGPAKKQKLSRDV
jgi:hypothetical protein